MAQDGVYVFPEGSTRGGSSVSDLALIAALNSGNGFGGMNNPLWMMFMYPFILPFLSMFGGGGFGGFGGFNGAGANVLGTGFLSNQLNNNNDKETILNALQYNREAISQLAQQTGNSISDVRSAIDIANSKLGEIGTQVGMTPLQVINAIQAGDANLGRQLCECCCNMRYDLAQQTNALQAQASQIASDAQLQRANNFAATQLQLANNHADDRLDVCQQTNVLRGDYNAGTNSILNAIKDQNTMITKEFCDLKERELQNKINTQGDIITQLRGQISNDKQTEQFNRGFAVLSEKINQIAAKQPNTVPVQYPNLVAANATPYVGQGYYGGYNGWGNGGVIL